MSALSNQADELRTLADRLRSVRFDDQSNYIKNVETMYLSMIAMREAAETIDNLRDSLNEVADKWASEKIKAEDYARENMTLKANNSSRWFELLGTPERATHTVVATSMACTNGECGECPFCGFQKCPEAGDYDALLEWLKQEVDA